jgi:hypothetical protein
MKILKKINRWLFGPSEAECFAMGRAKGRQIRANFIKSEKEKPRYIPSKLINKPIK